MRKRISTATDSFTLVCVGPDSGAVRGAVLHVAVEKNIVLTVAQVGLSKPAILLFVLVAVHAEGLSLLEPEKFNGYGYSYACLCPPRQEHHHCWYQALPFRRSVVRARPSATGIQHGTRRLRLQELVHLHRAVKWHESVPGGFVSA